MLKSKNNLTFPVALVKNIYILLGGEDSSGVGGMWGGFVWVAAVVSFDEITEDSGEPRLRYTAAAQQ